MVFLLCGACYFLHLLNSFTDPCHYWNRHAVAECLVARPISGWLVAVWNLRVIVGEAL
jgi:hypothetical protein